MACCSKCGGKIGVFKKSCRLGPEKARFCESCAEAWLHEEKKRIITALYADGEPKELFCIHRVMARDPHDYQHQLGGDLIFTDKGVCYAAVMKYKPPTEVIAVLIGGAIGSAIQQSKEKKARKKAWAEIPGEGLTRPTENLAKFLYLAKRVTVFPRIELVDVGFSLWGEFRVKTRDKVHKFTLENGRKTLKPHKAAIRAFLEAP